MDTPKFKMWPDSTQIDSTAWSMTEMTVDDDKGKEDEIRGTLTVKFKSDGAIYDYFKVPLNTWKSLLVAPSIGKFINSEIKGKFEYKKK